MKIHERQISLWKHRCPTPSPCSPGKCKCKPQWDFISLEWKLSIKRKENCAGKIQRSWNSHTGWWDATYRNQFGKQTSTASFPKVNTELSYDSAVPLLSPEQRKEARQKPERVHPGSVNNCWNGNHPKAHQLMNGLKSQMRSYYLQEETKWWYLLPHA